MSTEKVVIIANPKKNLLLLQLSDISDFVYEHLEQEELRNTDQELIEYLNELWCMINCDTEDYFYNAVCEAVEYFTIYYIIKPLKEIGYPLYNSVKKNPDDIFLDFETQAPLISNNSEVVNSLKEVWMKLSLQNPEMCDIIRYILIPTFVEERMTELRSLKKYYLEYREITHYWTKKDDISQFLKY